MASSGNAQAIVPASRGGGSVPKSRFDAKEKKEPDEEDEVRGKLAVYVYERIVVVGGAD